MYKYFWGSMKIKCISQYYYVIKAKNAYYDQLEFDTVTTCIRIPTINETDYHCSKFIHTRRIFETIFKHNGNMLLQFDFLNMNFCLVQL